MKLHDIVPARKHPGTPPMTESALATIGTDTLGDLRDIWVENEFTYALWVHRASGQGFVIYLRDQDYERHYYPTDYEYMVNQIREYATTGKYYSYYLYSEYTIKPDRTPVDPWRP